MRLLNQLKIDGPVPVAKTIVKRVFRMKRRTKVEEVASVYEILRNKVRARDGVMIDVGGHFGESLREFALDGWRVFTFEPDPENRKVLEKRYRRLHNVFIDTRGLSDHPSSNAAFYRSDVSSGISGLSSFHESHVQACEIELTTLSRFAHEMNVDVVDFLKIDTEGFDFLVLKGFPWERVKPKAIVCEFEDSKTEQLGYTYRDMGDFLIEKGFTVLLSEWFPIERYGVSHRWRELKDYPCQLADSKGWGNFVAFLDSVDADAFREAFAS